jgi:DNA-binding winged helix-turn-helix (wHTH) protein/Tol biopolymer transport system component
MRQIYEFGDFQVDPAEQLLLHQGRSVALAPKVFETLLVLLNSDGRLVDKKDFMDQLWPEVFVEDVALAQNISQLRKALNDGSNGTQMVQTVPKRGYRLTIPVQRVSIEEPQEKLKPSLNGNDLAQQKTNGNGSNLHPAQSTIQSAVAHEPKASPELPRDRRLLAAGLVAAVVVFTVVGFAFFRIIGKSYRASPRLGHWIAEQRVTSNPPEAPLSGAIVSPDGKYIAYADVTGLYLRQISTGETHPWPLPKGFVAWPDSWFPDGTHLLVVRLEGAGRIPGLDWNPSLWKVSLMGGPPQKIMDEAAGGSVSPDGTQIAYVPGHVDSTQLRVMNSDGGNVRTVASAGARDQPNSPEGWIYPEVWSPYGQRVAYVERHDVAAPPAKPFISIRTTKADGTASTVVLDDPRIGPALWWLPDGRILYAYREDPAPEGNNYGIYSIQVDEGTGRVIGKPRQITNAEGVPSGISATSDGKRLVVLRENTSVQAFITELNPISRKWTAPRRLTLDTNDNLVGAWTADSKAILFVSNRNGTWKLFKQNIDETIPEVLVEGQSIHLPRLSPDGSQALYLAGSKPGDISFPASLMSKPLAGGPARLVLQETGIINYECARAPSKLCVLSRLVGPDLIFFPFDLEHGAGRELARISAGHSKWGLSPDGSHLAVAMDKHRIRFLALPTGVAHDVTVNDWPLLSADWSDTVWSANSKSLFIQSRTPNGGCAILEVNKAGKIEVAIEVNSEFAYLIQSPDGRYGMLEMTTPGDNNAWMFDNF